MPIHRLKANPIITPADVAPTRSDLEIYCTLNPAAARLGKETILLVRVGEKAPDEPDSVASVHFDCESGEVKIRRIKRDDPDLTLADPRTMFYRGRMLLTSMSHLRIARSADGTKFKIDPQPAIFPSTPYEAYGCEDARITFLAGYYYVTYTAVSDRGVVVMLAVTRDFQKLDKIGVIFPPYQKDVVIFPEMIRRTYVCRHRPYKSEFNPACIWTAYSPDLRCWGGHEMTLAPTEGHWDAGRVGAGGVPIRTDDGWLEIYHASDVHGRYSLGAMLSDLDHPERIISRSSRPVMEPQAPYELTGVYGQCIFTNGLVTDEDGRLTIYYGAADRVCAVAVTTVEEMVAAAKE